MALAGSVQSDAINSDCCLVCTSGRDSALEISAKHAIIGSQVFNGEQRVLAVKREDAVQLEERRQLNESIGQVVQIIFQFRHELFAQTTNYLHSPLDFDIAVSKFLSIRTLFSSLD